MLPYETMATSNTSDAENLIKAAKANDKETVKLLIEAGADINAKNNDGYTALMLASWNGHKDVVKLLIEAEVDVNVKR